MSIYSITPEEFEALNRSLTDIFGAEYQRTNLTGNIIITDDNLSIPWNKGKEMDQDFRDVHKGYTFTPEQYTKVIEHLNRLRENLYTEERNLKISNSLKGKPLTQERKDNISKAKTGTIITEEHKRKISESMKGKANFGGHKHSPETRAKMAAAVRPPPWNKGKKLST